MNTVSLVSIKGGVGKSTLAANLAGALAARLGAPRVAVLDTDARGLLATTLGRHSELAAKGLIYQGSPVQGSAPPSNKVGAHGELAQALAQPALSQRVVFIDTAPGAGATQREAIEVADLSLVVVSPDAACYHTLPALERLLEQQAQRQRAFYVLNQFDARNTLDVDFARFLRQVLGNRMAPVVIGHDEGFRESLAVGQSVLEYAPHSRASHDVDQLSRWLVNTLNQRPH